jgi:hypothetical protein
LLLLLLLLLGDGKPHRPWRRHVIPEGNGARHGVGRLTRALLLALSLLPMLLLPLLLHGPVATLRLPRTVASSGGSRVCGKALERLLQLRLCGAAAGGVGSAFAVLLTLLLPLLPLLPLLLLLLLPWRTRSCMLLLLLLLLLMGRRRSRRRQCC